MPKPNAVNGQACVHKPSSWSSLPESPRLPPIPKMKAVDDQACKHTRHRLRPNRPACFKRQPLVPDDQACTHTGHRLRPNRPACFKRQPLVPARGLFIFLSSLTRFSSVTLRTKASIPSSLGYYRKPVAVTISRTRLKGGARTRSCPKAALRRVSDWS